MYQLYDLLISYFSSGFLWTKCFSFFETVFSLKLRNRQYLNLRLKSPSNNFLFFFFPSVSVREPLILQHIHNFRHSVYRKSSLQLGVSITSPWQGELVSAVFRSEHPGIRVHRAARSHPQTASHSALRSWHSSFRVATVAKTQTNFSNVTMVWFLVVLVSFLLWTFGNISLRYVSSMTCLAPGHAPGPMRRYWAAQQGPKKHLMARRGSLKKSLPRFGLQPIRSAIWSLYAMLDTWRLNNKKWLHELWLKQVNTSLHFIRHFREEKRILQLFLGSLLGTPLSAIGK